MMVMVMVFMVKMVWVVEVIAGNDEGAFVIQVVGLGDDNSLSYEGCG